MANKLLKTLNFGGADTYNLAPDWDNVENRPFGYETPTGGDTLTWDGTTSGLVNVMGVLYHVHDATPTVAEGTIEINSNGTVTSTSFTVEDKNDGVQYLVANNLTMAVIVPTDGITVDDLNFNKAGIYLRKSGSEYVSALTIKDCEEFTGIKTLDYQYLPKALRFGSDGVQIVDILPTTELTLTVDDDNGVADPISQAMLSPLNLQEGIEYKVKFNNDTFNCVAFAFSPFEGANFIMLGNGEVAGAEGGNGEPFVFFESVDEGVAQFVYNGALETATLSISYETENIIPIKTKYLPEHLQFGVEEGSEVTEILPPTQMILGDEINEGAAMSMHILANAIEGVVVGQTYTVNYNGTDYTCDAKEFTMEGITVTLLGDLSLLLGTENTGEPFGLMIVPPEQIATVGVGVILYSYDVATSVTLSISYDGSKIIKLDNKYLDLDWIPKSRKATGEVFNESLDFTSNTYKSFDEIKFEIMDGETYQVDWGGTVYTCVGRLVTSNYMSQLYQLGNTSLSSYGEKGEDTGEPFLFEYMILQDFLFMTFRIKSTSTSQVWVNVVGAKRESTPMPIRFAPETFNKVRTKALEMYDVDYNTHKIYFGINGPMYLQKNSEAVRQVATLNDIAYPVFTTEDLQTVTCNFTLAECLVAYTSASLKPFYFVINDGDKRYYLINKVSNISLNGSSGLQFESDLGDSKATIVYTGNTLALTVE